MENNTNQTNRIFIELHVPDFEVAKNFYSKLGFEIVSDDGITDGVGYFIMERCGTMINFYGGTEKVYMQEYFKRFPNETVRCFGVEIVIPVDNIDSYFSEVKMVSPDCIVQNLREHKEHWLLWRDFRVTDPFGFYLRFTEPINWKLCHCGSGKSYRQCHGK